MNPRHSVHPSRAIVPAGQAAPPAPAPAPVVVSAVPVDGATCPAAPYCPALPSSSSAHALMSGEPGALLRVLRDLIGRSALIGVGIFAAGERDPKKLALYALGGAAAIETAVFVYIAAESRAYAAKG